eukprot:COSAG05_NODE_1070_length_5967_cov_444.629857_5_plen_173_part_00
MEIISSVDDPDPRVLFGRLRPWITEIDLRESDRNSPHRMAPGKNLTANMDESGVGKVLLKLEWNRGREDLRGLRKRSKLRAGTRLRLNGMSSADDAAPKDGGKNEMARVQSELNRRGYYTLEPGGLDRLKKHRLHVGVELHPSQYVYSYTVYTAVLVRFCLLHVCVMKSVIA